jgi:hypothetical protein
MSEFAFFRFMSLNLLTQEESENKPEIVSITEEVLDAEGIECDSKISKLSEDKIKKILAEVRRRRRKSTQSGSLAAEEEQEEQHENPVPAK